MAREVLHDPRIDFQLSDWILQAVERGERFDLVSADTWEGKFFHREEAMSLVATGGFYVIDGLLPSPGGRRTLTSRSRPSSPPSPRLRADVASTCRGPVGSWCAAAWQ